MQTLDDRFYTELKTELRQISEYWSTNSVDRESGGFYGCRNYYNILVPKANKGIILNARILWSFSAICNYDQKLKMAPLATRAFDYLYGHFRDKKNGGVFWELDYLGNPVVPKKQIYAQAFTIYALSEYFCYSHNEEAREWAISLFDLVEKYAYDPDQNGYIEAFAENWSPMLDMRLSDKDQNVAKTMNTHLHLLEAYTTLYHIYPENRVRKALENLIHLFLEKFLNKEYNFELFFDENWNRVSDTISFGHDIESLWLLIEAAKATNNQDLIHKTKATAVPIADAFLAKGYIKNAGVLNELQRNTGELDTDRHWWPQVEAMVGLIYAYRVQPQSKYLDAIYDIWQFTQQHIIDHKAGEWHFRVDENFKPYTDEDKLSMWKCPYHNSRALIVMLNTKS